MPEYTHVQTFVVCDENTVLCDPCDTLLCVDLLDMKKRHRQRSEQCLSAPQCSSLALRGSGNLEGEKTQIAGGSYQ
jgi:hypothetical protein